MTGRIRQIIGGLVGLVLAVTIVVGVPMALVEFVGWPLPTTWPTVQQLRQFVEHGGIADSTVIKTLAVIVWLAWAQLAAAILTEAVGAARRRAPRRLPVLPGIQPVAAKLVAAIALLAATSGTARLSYALPLEAAVAAAPSVDIPEVGRDSPDPARHVTEAPTAPTTTVVASARDSWWRLAETHLGDGLRWREIRDLNVGRTVADGVVIADDTDRPDAGWDLLVPAPADAGAHDDPPQRQPTSGQWQVQAGDHFWSIAERSLADAWDRQPTDTEVAPYWQQVVEANRDRLLPPHDPDLIYPDQHFTVPPPPADPVRITADEGAEREPDRHETHVPHDTAPAAPDETVQTAPEQSQSEGVGPEQPERAPEVAVPDGWVTAIEQLARDGAVAANLDAEVDGEDEPTTVLGLPAGLATGTTAAALLASGVVATLRWRRRSALQRRAPGFRLPTPLPETPRQVATLDAAALAEDTLDDLASLLTSIPADAHPVLVTVSDDGAVTLLFDEGRTIPEPPAPWTLVHDGWSGPVGWEAAMGGRGPERSIGLPLLATLGRTGASNILANVGAMHTLAVAGPDDAVRRHLRTVSLEVATSRIAVPVEVIVAGDHLLASLDHVRHVEDLEAEVDAALTELSEGVIAEDRTPRLLVCHDGMRSASVPDELIGTVGLIRIGDEAQVRWRLQVDGDGTALLQLPDGGEVEVTLPDVDPHYVDDELRTLDQGAVIQDEEPAGDVIVLQPPSSNGHRPAVMADATRPSWCDVRLLGPTEVVRGQERLDDLTPRTMEMLAYLATHRDGVSKERLDDAIWAGRAAAPGSQRVTSALTRLRNILGDGPGGEPLVPRRTGSEPIRLSDHVSCDLDRAFAHLAIARDLPAEMRVSELWAALELVRGQPFEDLPVSWAADITQRAIIQLQDAALEVARTRREDGDFDAAEEAVRRGLLLLDPADALYLERAEIEKARGHPERVAHIWQQLRRQHAQDADEVAGCVSSPAVEIELAFREMMGASHA